MTNNSRYSEKKLVIHRRRFIVVVSSFLFHRFRFIVFVSSGCCAWFTLKAIEQFVRYMIRSVTNNNNELLSSYLVFSKSDIATGIQTIIFNINNFSIIWLSNFMRRLCVIILFFAKNDYP